MAQYMEGKISSTELSEHLLVRTGTCCRHSGGAQEQTIVAGRLSFIPLTDELQLHICHCVEQQQLSQSCQLPPSLNITILLTGSVAFRVAEKYYQFNAQTQPQAFANIIAKPEPFSRYLHRQQEVKKVTLSVSHSYLQKRMTAAQFASFNSTRVTQLTLDEEALLLTQELLNTSSKADMLTRLHCESLATKWLAKLLPEVMQQKSTQHAHYRLPPDTDIERKKSQIIDLLISDSSLEDIAAELAMSLSSLQRFFRQHFNTTPKRYLQQHKLNQASHALLIRGLSVGEAAYLAGYHHIGNFSAAFKKQFGITPMQFVDMHRHENNLT